MLRFTTGNLLDSSAEALVNTVNTVMGKGIALQFKNTFAHNYEVYRKACLAGKLETGQILAVRDSDLILGERLIINFPTKQHWKLSSKYEFIESGLLVLAAYLKENPVKSLACRHSVSETGAWNGNGSGQWLKTICPNWTPISGSTNRGRVEVPESPAGGLLAAPFRPAFSCGLTLW